MEFKSTKPIYLQITEYMNEKILLEEWKENERIPSVRELAVQLQVNPNTVMRSYDHLQQLDILINKRGIGYFANENARQRVLAQRRNEFVELELPVFFKTMSLLQIDMVEMQTLYNEFIKNSK